MYMLWENDWRDGGGPQREGGGVAGRVGRTF